MAILLSADDEERERVALADEKENEE